MLSLRAVAFFAMTPVLAALDFAPYAGPEAVTIASRAVSLQATWRRLIVDVHRERGLHEEDPAAEAEVVALLERAVDVRSGLALPEDFRRDETLVKRVSSERKPRDVLVQWAAFAVLQGRAVPFQVNRLCDAVRRRATEENLPPLLRAHADLHCLSTWGDAKKEEDRAMVLRIAEKTGERLTAAIRAGEGVPDPRPLVSVVESIPSSTLAVQKLLADAVDHALTDSQFPAWAQATMRAKLAIKLAWAHRGSGWANTVTPEGWAQFSEYLKRADTLLESAYAADPQQPIVCSLGLTVAGAGHASSSDAVWLTRALSACLDSHGPLNTYLTFHQPRWGGSYDEILHLACDAVAAERWDSRLPLWFLSSLQQVISDGKSMKMLPAAQAALGAPRVRATFERVVEKLAEGPSGLTVRWAEIGYLAHTGRLEEARRKAADLPEPPTRTRDEFAKDWAFTLRDAPPKPPVEPTGTDTF